MRFIRMLVIVAILALAATPVLAQEPDCPPTAATMSGVEGAPLWVAVLLAAGALLIGLIVGGWIGKEIGWEEAKLEDRLDDAIMSLEIPVNRKG
jgi:hypothetical protein